MKSLLYKMMKIMMVMMLLAQTLQSVPFVHAHAETVDIKPTIEKQVRAYAKSINRSNADDEAAKVLAKHGLTAGGKDLNVGSSNALTATLMNAEMTQVALTDTLDYLIRLINNTGEKELHAYGGLAFYGSDASNDGKVTSNYGFYVINSSNGSYADSDHHVMSVKKFAETSKLNEYDKSLEWMAGQTSYRVKITPKSVSQKEATFQVKVEISDIFNFEVRGNDGFKDLMSGIGAILFKEFNWKSTVTFDVKVPYEPCDHQLHHYEIGYDKENKSMFSYSGQGVSENQVTSYSWMNSAGNNSYYYILEDVIRLFSDQPWVIEYDIKQFSKIELSLLPSSGSVKYPSLRHTRGSNSAHYATDFMEVSQEIMDGMDYTSSIKTIIQTYEADLKDISINNKNIYTYRYENIIDSKGKNKVYLTILEPSTGNVLLERRALDDYYEAKNWENSGKPQLITSESNWANGKDLLIQYIGTKKIPFSAGAFNLRVWEGGKESDGSAYEATKVVKPTCTADGYTVYTCSRCGHSYNGDVVKKLGHDYKPVTTNPTCTEDGFVTHTCSRCKDSYVTEGAEKLGHVEIVDTEAVDATCTEAGLTESTHCERCEEVLMKQETVEALGHDYEDVITDPTCTEQGYTTHTCTRCEETYTDAETEALGHEFTKWEVKVEATPEKEGVEARVCTVCDHEETRSYEYVPHTYETEVIAPTCTEQGYTLYTCTECGESYKDNYTEVLDHEYGQWYVETEPTHHKEGVERRECMHCEAYETREVEIKEHSYTTEVVAPTCTEEGYTLYVCECGESYKDDFTGTVAHRYGQTEVIVEATCLEGGLRKHICTECGHEEEIKVEPLGHKYKSKVIAPKCEEGGYTEHRCERCEESYRDDYTEAAGHDFSPWVDVIAATCLEEGMQMRDCGSCAHYETKETEALGHSYESVVVNPDCMKDGYTEHSCIRCEDSYQDTVVPSNGHGYTEWAVEVEATCLKAGVEERYCTGCNEKETREIEALGHEIETKVIEATCLKEGYTEHSCIRCEERSVSDPTAALGHEYESEVIDATCTQEGYTKHTCTRCEDEYKDSYTEVLEHTYGNWKIVEKPTLEKEGLEKRECTECGDAQTRVMAKTEHQYTTKEIEPTCEKEGYTEYRCTECGYTVQDHIVEKLGHEYGQWYEFEAPTCKKPGVERRDCERCGKFEIQASIPARHDYEDKVVEATCTEMGYTVHVCRRCKSTTEDSYVPAKGHSFGQWVVLGEPECLSKGAERRDCEVCEGYETRETEELPHDYEAVYTDATCTEEGYTTYICTRCQDTKEGEKTEALGHEMSAWEITKEPTCTEAGEESRKCERCEYTESQEAEATGHKMGKWETKIEATCLEKGSETRKCENCAHTESQEVNALGHKYVDNGKAATCTEAGVKKEVCQRCKDAKPEEALKALGHKWLNKTVSVTCTRNGYTETYCENCGQSTRSNEVSAYGHSYGEYISDGNATVDKDGTKTATCTKCGKKDSVIDAGTKKVVADYSLSTTEEKLSVSQYGTLDLSKIKLMENYTDGTSAEILDYQMTGFNSSEIGEQEVTISYKEFSEVLEVVVEEATENSGDNSEDSTEGTEEQGIPAGIGIIVLGGLFVGMSLLGKKLLFKKKTKNVEEVPVEESTNE